MNFVIAYFLVGLFVFASAGVIVSNYRARTNNKHPIFRNTAEAVSEGLLCIALWPIILAMLFFLRKELNDGFKD